MIKIIDANEELPEFVNFINQKAHWVTTIFKKIANHCGIAPEKQNIITIYCYQPTDYIPCKFIKEIDLEYSDEIPPVFFDWQATYKETPKGFDAIKITVNYKFAGIFFPHLSSLWLTDWTHDETCLEIAEKLFLRLIELLFLGDKLKTEDKPIIRSQKGKGIVWLIEKALGPSTIFVNHYFPDNTPIIILEKDQVFIRSCPQNPRHGILENYIVPANKHLIKIAVEKLAQEMFSQGEYPEIVIQPYFADSINIVYNNRNLSFGLGNAGVTAGSDWNATITINGLEKLENKIKKELGLDSFDIEMIYDRKSDKSFVVQIRESPKQEEINQNTIKGTFKGFLPKSCIRIKDYKVVVIKGLTNIEELENTKDSNIICVHIDGNLLSHAAAWCRLKNIPYIIIENPKLLERYEFLIEVKKNCLKLSDFQNIKTENYEIDWNEDWFKEGFFFALGPNYPRLNFYGWENIIFFQTYASGLNTSKTVAFLAGCFAGAVINCIIMLGYGEARHFYEQIEGKKTKIKYYMNFPKVIIPPASRWDRHFTYDLYCAHKLNIKEKFLLAYYLAKTFLDYNWKNTGYGGVKWGSPIAKVVELLKTVINSEKLDVKQICHQINNLTHVAHNGGWYFNKILTEDIFEIYSNIDLPKIETTARGFSVIKKYQGGKNENNQ